MPVCHHLSQAIETQDVCLCTALSNRFNSVLYSNKALMWPRHPKITFGERRTQRIGDRCESRLSSGGARPRVCAIQRLAIDRQIVPYERCNDVKTYADRRSAISYPDCPQPPVFRHSSSSQDELADHWIHFTPAESDNIEGKKQALDDVINGPVTSTFEPCIMRTVSLLSATVPSPL